MSNNIILILFILVLGISFVAIILKNWKWMPVFLLPILWYVPRQTATGGLLENYIFLRWLSVLIIPLIIFIQLMRMVVHSKTIKFSKIILPLGFFVIVYLFSGILNHSGIMEILGSLILYIKYPLLFIILINMNITKKVVNAFTFLFIFLVLLQIPECLYRGLILGIRSDTLSFTLGPWGTLDLGVYMIYAVAAFSAFGLVKSTKRMNLIYVLIFTLFFVIALLGEIKGFIFAAPIVILFTVYGALGQKRKRVRVASALLFSSIPFILFFLIVSNWSKIYYGSSNTLTPFVHNLTNIFRNPFFYFENQSAGSAGSRISAGFVVWNYLSKNLSTLLFGLGPGSSLAGNFFGHSGKLFNLNIPYLNQIGALLGEVGLIGFFIYFWMLVIILRIILKANAFFSEEYLYILSASLIGIWFYYAVFGPFYDLIWRHDASSYIFYFYAAVIYNHYKEMELHSFSR